MVDDNPVENSSRTMVEGISDARVRYLQGEGRGPGAARNLAVTEAQGEFVAFLDDDDHWIPDKLRRQSQALRSDPAAVCYGPVTVEREGGATAIRPPRPLKKGESVGDYLLLHGGLMQTSTLALSRQTALRHPFPGGVYEDWRFVLDLEASGVRFISLEEPCAVWDRSKPGGLSVVCLTSAQSLYAHPGLSRHARRRVRVRYLLPARLERGEPAQAWPLLLSCLGRSGVSRVERNRLLGRLLAATLKLGREPRGVGIGPLLVLRCGLSPEDLKGLTERLTELQLDWRGLCWGEPSLPEAGFKRVDFGRGLPGLLRSILAVGKEMARLKPSAVLSAGEAAHAASLLTPGGPARFGWLHHPRFYDRYEILLGSLAPRMDAWLAPDHVELGEFRRNYGIQARRTLPAHLWPVLDRVKQPRVLVVSRDYPYPMDNGSRIRTGWLLKQLRKEFHVTMLCSDKPRDRKALERAADYCHDLYLAERHPTRPPHWSIPEEVSFFSSLPLEEVLARRLATEAYDLVICDHLHSSLHFPGLFKHRTMLWQQNVESLLQFRWALLGSGRKRLAAGWEALKLFGFERRACRRFDSVVAVSERDAELLSRLYGGIRVSVVPSGVDVEEFQPPESHSDVQELCYTGNMRWFPNEDALRFFAGEILAGIRAACPNLKVFAVGGEARPELHRFVSAFPEISLTGWVPDVRPYLQRASVVIVPLRAGSGTRLKILQALACGCAVVSTPLGAEGLPVKSGRELLIADNPSAFGEAVIGLLKDPGRARRMGQRGREFVSRCMTWDQAGEKLRQVVREALA